MRHLFNFLIAPSIVFLPILLFTSFCKVSQEEEEQQQLFNFQTAKLAVKTCPELQGHYNVP